MHILSISGSAVGEKSMSKTVFDKIISYTKDKGAEFEYDEVLYGKVKKDTLNKLVEKADLIVFTTSPFHCALQSGFTKFLIDNFSDGSLKGKAVAGFLSSSGLFEKICEAQLKTILTELGAWYVSGYSSVEYEFMENHEKPADIHIRTGNNIEDMRQWLLSVISVVENNTQTKSFSPVLVITAVSEDNDYCSRALKIIEKRYSDIEIIDLNKLKIVDCTGCKYCYTDKVCCMKDDMLSVEKKLKEYDSIIHITDMVYGVLNPVYMSFIQREVHNGLYPFPEYANKKLIRIVDSCGFETSLTKEYLTSLSSFGRMYSAVLTDDEVENFEAADCILSMQQENNAMPNMDGYTKIYTRHFDNLSCLLQNLLKPEYAFFKDHPYCKPAQPNAQAREIHSMEDARMAQMGRIMPVVEFMKKEKKGIFKIWKK